MKKIYLLFLFTLCTNFMYSLPPSGSNGYYFTVGDYDYEANSYSLSSSTNATIIRYRSHNNNNLIIPSEVTIHSKKLKVSSIGNKAFKNASIKKVTLPASINYISSYAFEDSGLTEIIFLPGTTITTINSYVFSGCYRLNKITIPSTVNSIGSYAFSGSSLDEIIIPNTVKSISSYAFYYCNWLTKVELPNSISEIKIFTFANCSRLKDINIPSSVIRIGESVFESCTSLVNISMPSSVVQIDESAFEGCSSLESFNSPSSLLLGDYAFKGCTSLKDIDFHINHESTGIGVFESCTGFVNITIPVSYRINKNMFAKCSNLSSVSLNKISRIDANAFEDCTSLKTVNLSSNLYSIGDYAFFNSGLEEITIPNSVKNMGESIFYGCKNLTKATLSTSIERIEQGTFAYCENLKDVKIPSRVASIGESAFRGTAIAAIEIPSGVQNIDKYAFSGCTNLTKIELPKNLKIIEDRILTGSGITELKLPDSLTTIKFFGLSYLKIKTVELPKSLHTIENSAFQNTNFEQVIVKNPIPIVLNTNYNNKDVFGDSADLSSVTLIVPDGAKSAYKNAEIWKEFGEIIEESNGYSFSKEDFDYQVNDFTLDYSTSVTIVKYKKSEVNADLMLPTEVTIDGKTLEVNTIGKNSFKDSNIRSLKIPSSIKFIEANAFENSTLEEITTPNTLKTIAAGAFSNCTKLKSINLPNSLTRIEKEAFKGCSTLDSIVMPDSLTHLGNSVFEDAGLTYVEIPRYKFLNEFGHYRMFYNCQNLQKVRSTSIYIPFHIFFEDIYFFPFGNIDLSKVTLIVPDGAISRYNFRNDGWKDFGTIIEESSLSVKDVQFTANFNFTINNNIVSLDPKSGIEILKVEVLNITGKEIFNLDSNRIDISQLASGIYLLKVTTNKGVYSKKILKE